MKTFRAHIIALLAVAAGFALAACEASGGSSTVKSSGRPVNPFADPGTADQPSAPLTGAQPQRP